ncbi:MAG: hypothetical protein NTW59_00140 [Candidatus Diapherotrites archaeon]|nr:hypothetical protein [Candidatus Diapherotrites archaeon]
MRCLLPICVLLLLFSYAAAADCTISSTDSKEFKLSFAINGDGTVMMRMLAKIPYTKECVLRRFGEVMQNGACDGKTISDSLFKAMDFFISRSDCNWSYDSDAGMLGIETMSLTEKLVKDEEGVQTLRFNTWVTAPSMPDANNTLWVVLPPESEIVSYFPQKDSVKTKNGIFWPEIPADPIGVRFRQSGTAQQAQGTTALAIAAVAAAAAAVGLVYYKKSLAGRRKNEKISGLSKKEEMLSRKLEELHMMYLKRRIDEKTYRDAVENASLELSSVKAEKKALLEKAGIEQVKIPKQKK